MLIELKNSKQGEKDLQPAAYQIVTDSLIEQLEQKKRSIMIDAGKGFFIAYIGHNSGVYYIEYYREALYIRMIKAAARIIKAAADKVSAAAADIAR
jgi:hypothetical protein